MRGRIDLDGLDLYSVDCGQDWELPCTQGVICTAGECVCRCTPPYNECWASLAGLKRYGMHVIEGWDARCERPGVCVFTRAEQ